MVFHIATHPDPEVGIQSLPPMLSKANLDPMTRYSKASWGLSVLLRVNGIFTDIASSSSFSLRQSPTRYAIRAGRNLHDKEFRYHRTVIVTAGVHQGLAHQVAPAGLTF